MRNDNVIPIDRLRPKRTRIRPWERKLALVFFCCSLGLALWMQSCTVHAETYATAQSKEPWSIVQCDKLGKRAVAVFNVSMWNAGGWPLWRVTCLYR